MNTTLPVSSRLFNATKATGTLFLLVFAFLFGFSKSAKAQASQTITFHAIGSKAYGTADFSPGATASSGLAVSYVSSNTAVATIVNGNIHIVGVGTSQITASQAGNASFKKANSVTEVLTVTAANLTVTATTANKTYGMTLTGSDGSTAFISSGLVNGETIGSVTITYFSGAAATDGIGDYLQCTSPSAATGGTFNPNNYNITYVATDLNVAAANLTITADSVIKPYGNVLTGGPGSTAFTSVGLQNGETIGSVTISYSSGSAATDGIGDYIQCVGIASDTLGTFDPNNYNVTLVGNNIDVVPAVLTITGISISDKGFDGTTDAVIVGTPTLNGVVNGDIITLVTDTAVAVFNSPAAGSNVPVTVSGYDISGDNSFDYTLTQPTGLTANIIGASDASLSNLIPNAGALNPVFASGTQAYTESVSNAVSSITLTPMATDTNATVTVNGVSVPRGSASGSIGLNVGSNTLTVIVTAQDGVTTETYSVGVTRAPAAGAGATLSALKLSKGTISPAFTSGTTSYTTSVANGTASITITPTAADPTAAITVNGIAVTSGSASQSLPLVVGPNTITTVVTAQDGVTTTTYTLIVTEQPSAVATLSGLTPGTGKLSPAFNVSAFSYTESVASTVSTITVTPTSTVNTATIKVNGTTVASGTASSPIALNIGSNTITVAVTAQDGVTTKTYTVNVSRLLSTNALLSALKTSKGVISPVFASGTTSYTSGVANGTASITITPFAADATATITVNGIAVASGSASGAIALSVGPNTITTVVTAQDGVTTKTYTLVVTEQPSVVATLSGLTPGTGKLSPAFNVSAFSYTESVAGTVSTITVTPTSTVNTATIKVNGTTVASGTASSPIALNVGSNTITVAVTAQDGITTKTYTITVTRLLSTNANLSSLKPSKGTISPGFGAATSYTAGVANAVTSITITPTAADPTATITVNGVAVASGTASGAIALAVGANTITTVVTAQDGSTTKTYTLTVTRQATNNDNLSALTLSQGTLSPAFVSTTGSYTDAVANTVTSVTVTPTTSDPDATVTVNGTTVTSGSPSAPVVLSVGANTISVAVTASNGTTTKTYTLTVTRAKSTNANLSAFKLSKGTLSPVFASGTTSYTTSVANGTPSITITPTAADPTATITINGVAVASGSASQSLPLVVGPNTITAVVTAQDGVTTKTYTLVVTEQPSAIATLSGLIPGTGKLSPAFNVGVFSYTESVANTVSTITVTPTSTVNTATITVNGTAVTSGTASGAIALAVGANTITTVVTAQDGISTKTYTLTVTRAAGATDEFDISVSKPRETPSVNDDIVAVHQGVSPNGDGINDFLVIDGIQAYPDNKLSIMNRNGQLIYEAQGYDNSSKMFDGHSNKNGQMQLPGTYFYQLDYTVKGITKHKTGYIILKY